MSEQKKIPVVELFGPVLQGEGALAGQVSHFLRFGGCSFRCHWCDSMHAVDPKQIKKHATYMTQEEMVDKLITKQRPEGKKTWVTLTGGDPCMWNLYPLVVSLGIRGYRTAVETQGSIYQDWLSCCDLVTCSPKPPSSGMFHKINYDILSQYNRLDKLVWKIVIFDEDDLVFAQDLAKRYPKHPFYLSAGTPTEGVPCLPAVIANQYRWLTEQVLAKPSLHHATVLPQLHALCFGHEKGR